MAPKKKKSTSSDKPTKESLKKKKKSESEPSSSTSETTTNSSTTTTTVDTNGGVQDKVSDSVVSSVDNDHQKTLQQQQQEPNNKIIVPDTPMEEFSKKRKSNNEDLSQPEPQRRKFQLSLKPSNQNKNSQRFTPLSDNTTISPLQTSNEKGEKCKNSCYMCQIHRQRSGEPEPIPYIDRSEKLTTSYLEGLCQMHRDIQDISITHKSISDLCTTTILDTNQDLLLGNNLDDFFRFEKKMEILTGLPPSVVIRLFPSHFVLEVADHYQMNTSPQTKTLKYNEMTKMFLFQISKCKLVPDLLGEFKDLNCTFYDGSIIVHVIDMRVPENPNSKMYPTQEIILRAESTYLEKDIYEFLDDNSTNLSVKQRLEVAKCIVHTVKNDLSTIRKTSSICLDPNPRVSLVANAVQYNKMKSDFRRRKRPIVHFTQKHKTPLSNNQTIEGLSATGGAPKQEHNLLNFIAKSKTWSDTLISRKDKVTLLHLPNSSGKKKKQKLSSKQKKSKDNETFPRNISSESFPAEYAKILETILVNCKPPNRCRILKFESYDKTKTWRVDILPYLENGTTDNSKKFEAYILPPHTFTQNNQPVFSHEQPSSCIVGGRHAAELYARRLKDMFTSNGKTKLVMDHEIDLQTYITDNRLTKPPHLLQRLSKLGSHSTIHKPVTTTQTPVTSGQSTVVVNPNMPTQSTTMPTQNQYQPVGGTSGGGGGQQTPIGYTNVVGAQLNTRPTAADTIFLKKMLSSMPQRQGNAVNSMVNPTTVGGAPQITNAQVAAAGNPIQQVFYQPVQTGMATSALHYLNSVINPQQVQRANYGINYVLPNGTPFLASNRQPNSANPTNPNIIINPNQPTQNKQ